MGRPFRLFTPTAGKGGGRIPEALGAQTRRDPHAGYETSEVNFLERSSRILVASRRFCAYSGTGKYVLYILQKNCKLPLYKFNFSGIIIFAASKAERLGDITRMVAVGFASASSDFLLLPPNFHTGD